MTELQDDDKRRRDLWDEHRKQAWQDIQSSTDNFDKNLLAVSSAALGFSVAFIKDIVRLPATRWHFVLYASWLCFAVCIVITVFSFRLSVAALNKHLEYLQHYYEKKDETFFDEKEHSRNCAQLVHLGRRRVLPRWYNLYSRILHEKPWLKRRPL